MIFSDRQILASMEIDDIVIHPYKEANLSTSSYDVSLGQYYFREMNPSLMTGEYSNMFNIYDQSHVKRVWGEPLEGRLAGELFHNSGLPIGFKADDRVITLDPGETILAHTEEFIGGRESITTMMKARSSIGRCFILVCKCAGWGDVGYINRWTMEITNVSRHYGIPLLCGSRVAQIVFLETGLIRGPDYSHKGAYQKTTDLDRLVAEWQPMDMLPCVRP